MEDIWVDGQMQTSFLTFGSTIDIDCEQQTITFATLRNVFSSVPNCHPVANRSANPTKVTSKSDHPGCGSLPVKQLLPIIRQGPLSDATAKQANRQIRRE